MPVLKPMRGFAFWVTGMAACVMTLGMADLLLFSMIAYFFLLVFAGGIMGYVHGYCERDLEARQEVLMQENSVGRN